LHKARNREELAAALEDAFGYDNTVLVEEVLTGTELTTLVYGAGEDVKALPPAELLKGGDFLTAAEKFLPGGAQMITPPRLPAEVIEQVKELSVKTFRALSLKVYSRIDSFYVPGRGVVILEPNNPPAMTPSTALWLAAAEEGLNARQFLDEIIQLALKLHAEKLGPL
jgi:D-alanine-D-alanine ligase